MKTNVMFEKIKAHVGHAVEVVTYGSSTNEEDQVNVSIECLDCNEVLVSYDIDEEE